MLEIKLTWFDAKGKCLGFGVITSTHYKRTRDLVRAIEVRRRGGEQGLPGLRLFDDPMTLNLLITWDKGAKLCLRS